MRCQQSSAYVSTEAANSLLSAQMICHPDLESFVRRVQTFPAVPFPHGKLPFVLAWDADFRLGQIL